MKPRALHLFAAAVVVAATMAMATTAKAEEQKVGETFCEQANLGVTTAKSEVYLQDGARVDCIVEYPLATYAVEIDKSGKWAECIGQALLYGIDSKANAVCALFQDSKTTNKSYTRHINRAKRVIDALKEKEVNITLFCIQPTGTPQKC